MATAVSAFESSPTRQGTRDIGPRSPENRIRSRKVEGRPEANNTTAQPSLSPKSPKSPQAPDNNNPNPKQILQNILATTAQPSTESSLQSQQETVLSSLSKTDTPSKQPVIWIDGEADKTDDKVDQASIQNDSYTRAAEFNPSHTMTVAHTRRNANGTIGSVYSGNKIKHLKKEDGIPLWRKDIQLEFLRCVFNDENKVFTKAFDGTKGHTFADIYVDAMARSSKTSKILKEKLLADRDGAMHMAMICLLVNVGRMNTTLNFFPEMRAQLRTYHSIPSLQANTDTSSYKQLQDAPRLKSILKGASEDANQPSTIDKIKALPVPRTNPVNLIFVLSQYAPKISETHFQPPRDFFDLVMRPTLSSKSRARAFLWLIWFYLESDFSAKNALCNPFGPGQTQAGEPDGLPFKVPGFDHLTEAQGDAENIDTQEEKDYGELKRQERIHILQEDETVGPPLKKAKKSEFARKKYQFQTWIVCQIEDEAYRYLDLTTDDLTVIAISDNDPTRTPSPTSAIQIKPKYMDYDGPSMEIHSNLQAGGPSLGRFPPPMQRSDSNPRLVLKTRVDNCPRSSSPAPPGFSHPILHSSGNNGLGSRRQRPETSHQKAVNMNRKMRVNHILHKQIGVHHDEARKKKKQANSSFGLMVMNRVKDLPEMYDTEDENSRGPGGLVPNSGEVEDFGEEAVAYKKAIDRAVRRLFREETSGPLGRLVNSYRKGKRRPRGYAEDEGKQSRAKKWRGDGGRRGMDGVRSEEALDDLDRDLLGEGRDEDDEMDEDSRTDESEGDDGDMTEDEVMVDA